MYDCKTHYLVLSLFPDPDDDKKDHEDHSYPIDTLVTHSLGQGLSDYCSTSLGFQFSLFVNHKLFIRNIP